VLAVPQELCFGFAGLTGALFSTVACMWYVHRSRATAAAASVTAAPDVPPPAPATAVVDEAAPLLKHGDRVSAASSVHSHVASALRYQLDATAHRSLSTPAIRTGNGALGLGSGHVAVNSSSSMYGMPPGGFDGRGHSSSVAERLLGVTMVSSRTSSYRSVVESAEEVVPDPDGVLAADVTVVADYDASDSDADSVAQRGAAPYVPLSERPFTGVLRSREFVFIASSMLLHFYKINWYLGTTQDFLDDLGDHGHSYARIAASMLAGGVLFIAVMSRLNTYSLWWANVVTSAAGLLYAVLELFRSLPLQMVTAFVFTFYRFERELLLVSLHAGAGSAARVVVTAAVVPRFVWVSCCPSPRRCARSMAFAVLFTFLIKVFGAHNIGRLSGLVRVTSAAMQFSMIPLLNFVETSLHNDFFWTHIGGTAISVVTLALCAWIRVATHEPAKVLGGAYKPPPPPASGRQ
jgi:hypothetical protein